MKRQFLTFFIVVILCQWGCATEVRLTTTPPGIDVFAGDKKIGTTPLTMAPSALGSPNGDGYLVQLQKTGFKKTWIWLPKGIKGVDLAINMAPFQLSSGDLRGGAGGEVSRKKLYEISSKMLRLQSRILLGDADSETDLKELVNAYPDLGSIQYLQALSLVRQGKKSEAVQILKTAVKQSPREADFLVLLNELAVSGETPKK